MTTLHAARKTWQHDNITCSKSSIKLEIALQKNTWSFVNKYNIGDKVFYKHNDSPEWKGPANVLGHGGQV